MLESIVIRGTRQNNLKNIDIDIPRNQLVVLTGVSGSGKSSLAFDTLYAEGQRRYMESLSTYARQFLEKMDKPDVDLIDGIAPAIAIEQKNPVKHARSTVGTASEVYDHLRLMFAKIGRTYCPECDAEVHVDTIPRIIAEIFEKLDGRRAYIVYPLEAAPSSRQGDLATPLLKRGFVRVRIDGRLFHLVDDELPPGPWDSFQVVVDRIVLKEETDELRTRIAGSLETAFEEGLGTLQVVSEEEETFTYCQAFRCTHCDIAFERPSPLLFSFNSPKGACPECKGFGNKLDFDLDLIVPNRDKSLAEGAIDPWTKPSYRTWNRKLAKIAKETGIDPLKPFRELTKKELRVLVNGYGDYVGLRGFFKELERKKYKLHKRVFLRRYQSQKECHKCHGAKLRPEALCIRIGELSIVDINRMSIREARDAIAGFDLNDFERIVARDIIRQILDRLDFLIYVGLDYLTLNRLTRTLSGGEAQRINLANQLGAHLAGVLYILDEPSIGLHPRDNQRLLSILKRLTRAGNSVIVVEHDRDVIEAADYVIELGPRAGENGGRVVYKGPIKDFHESRESITAQYLTGRKSIPVREWRKPAQSYLSLTGASINNLKDVTLKVPLERFTCVTGVSGSGKSTLVHDTLFNALDKIFHGHSRRIGRFKKLIGIDKISDAILLDQRPIGKTPRSNPVTYINAFNDIRTLFSQTPAAMRLGLGPGHFSFNVPGGRCEHCKGEGHLKLEMHFIADIFLTCDECGGSRYKKSTLDVSVRGRNIGEVLAMTVEEAITHFSGNQKIIDKLQLLHEVGLGYIRLGQPATTLSGGEAQRLKIAAELGKRNSNHVLYILDEPTTGLHLDDIERLLTILNKLVDEGNTVLVIEHNLDVIKTADHIIDLGPEGGDAGGLVVAEGSPEELIEAKGSITGKFLKIFLESEIARSAWDRKSA